MQARVAFLALMILFFPSGFKAAISAAACTFDPKDYPDVARDAIELIERGDYRRSIPILEDAWDANPQNIKLAEMLGFAYQYSLDRSDRSVMLKNASETMQETLDSGGTAVFLMDYANTEKNKLQDLDRGQVRLTPQTLEFCSVRSEFKMSVPLASLASYGLSRKKGADVNAFWLSRGGKEQMLFRPSTFTKDEVEALFALIEKLTGRAPTPVEK